ncbi:MAG: transposase [Novosphingobium sp.]
MITVVDEAIIDLETCVAGLAATQFHPDDPDNLGHAARLLRQLGNNREFLGDLLVEELAHRHRDDPAGNPYGPQSLILSAPGSSNFFLRGNIWPSRDEHMLRASGGSAFVYGLPHDHNFNFLTLGYFGPGYWSDYYEFAYDAVTGWRGEPVDLRFVERSRLEEGKIMLYRAHRDVHRQLPPDALSVSINVMHTSGAQGWLDQYAFDIGQGMGKVARILSAGSSEAFLRISVGLGHAEARDLARHFGRRHPSDRMRLAAWSALAAAEPDNDERDAVWRAAETSGSRLVSAEARLRRRARAG